MKKSIIGWAGAYMGKISSCFREINDEDGYCLYDIFTTKKEAEENFEEVIKVRITPIK